MRRNLVLFVVLLGLVAIAGLVLLQPKPTGPQTPTTSPTETHDAAPTLSLTGASALAHPQTQASASEPGSKLTNDLPGDSPEAKHQAYVEARTAELMDLAMDDSPQSLNTILSELNNRDPEIRKAAVEAAVQFGSRDAIPNLMDAAAQTDDPKEKKEIMEAVEFLKLPTLSEVTAQANSSPPHNPGTNLSPAGLPR
jgi:hypothetical protein